VSSPPELSLRGTVCRGRLLILFLLSAAVLWSLAPAAAVDRLALRLGDLASPMLALQRLSLEYESGAAVLRVDRLRLGQRQWRDLALRCSHATLTFDAVHCGAARLSVAGRVLPLVAELELAGDGRGELGLTFADGGRLGLTFEGGALRARADRLALDKLHAALAGLDADIDTLFERFRPVATLDGELRWGADGNSPARVSIDVRLFDAGFGSADGLQAGESLELAISGTARALDDGWAWQGEVEWRHGAAYLHPLYLEAGPSVRAQGRLQGGVVVVERSEVALEGVGRLDASARVELDTAAVLELELELTNADLGVLGPRWIAPLIAPASADRMYFGGQLDGLLRLQDGVLAQIDARLEGAGFGFVGAAGGGGFALGPVGGTLAWHAGASTSSRLRIGGGQWERIALGSFELEASLDGRSLSLAPARLPVLDGALVIEHLTLAHTDAGWQGVGGVVIEPVSMPLLTEALEMPRMGGVLAASLPDVRVSPGEITLNGALVVSVFDGYLQATGLRLVEPFGVASHLSADIEGRRLDLSQLTDTFSFGSVTGFVDLSLAGLELVRWRPVAFDARISSSPGRYPRRISQRAVQNISALGGGGAMAAVQRSLLGIFDTFGYRELGLTCRLRAGVCMMDGVEGGARADGGFVIVRGGGVPALDVIGYNRRVNWNELVERLQRVMADNVSPELR